MEHRAFVVKDLVCSFSNASVARTQSSEVLGCLWDNVIVKLDDYSTSIDLVDRYVEKTSWSDMSRLKAPYYHRQKEALTFPIFTKGTPE